MSAVRGLLTPFSVEITPRETDQAAAAVGASWTPARPST